MSFSVFDLGYPKVTKNGPQNDPKMELRWTQDPAWQGLGTILEVRENSPKKRSKSGAAVKSGESRERGGGLPLKTSNPGHWQLAGRLAAGRLADWQT